MRILYLHSKIKNFKKVMEKYSEKANVLNQNHLFPFISGQTRDVQGDWRDRQRNKIAFLTTTCKFFKCVYSILQVLELQRNFCEELNSKRVQFILNFQQFFIIHVSMKERVDAAGNDAFLKHGFAIFSMNAKFCKFYIK